MKLRNLFTRKNISISLLILVSISISTNIFRQKLNPQKTAVTDVSFNRTILRIEGEKVFTLLSKYLVANLDKILQSNYTVAQTIFIKIPILIVRNDTNKKNISIDMHMNRSHAKYIYELLVDGSKALNI